MRRSIPLLIMLLLVINGQAAESLDQRAQRKRAMARRPAKSKVDSAAKGLSLKSKRAAKWDGTEPGRLEREWAIHNASTRTRSRLGFSSDGAEQLVSNSFDFGEIAVIEDDGSIVGEVPGFDLDGQSLRFTPNAQNGYDLSTSPLNFEPVIGTNLALGDDSFSEVMFTMGFTFSFFGTAQSSVFVNANGNLTFGQGDTGFLEIILIFGAPVPRIAPLFRDFSPNVAGGVFVRQLSDRLIITWSGVPEFATSNSNTFQATLFDDGTIDMHYNGIDTEAGKVGLFPGLISQAVDFSSFGTPTMFTGAVYENFILSFDLDNSSLTFTPNGDSGYDIVAGASAFDPTLGTPLNLLDDDFESVVFAGGFSFPFFGDTVRGFHINSNGSITINFPDPFFSLSVQAFLELNSRISPAFIDLNPQTGGNIFFKQLADRVVVTWSNISTFGTTNSNTFQVTCFNTGVIRFDYTRVDASSALTGIIETLSNQDADWSAGIPATISGATCELFGVNLFDLNGRRLTFTPNGQGHDVALSDAAFDSVLGADLGLPNEGTTQIAFTGGFVFPFFGLNHTDVFVNSNGNLTFGQGDPNNFDPSIGDMLLPMPRIAPLFADLDPSDGGGVFFRQEADRAIFTWVNVPEFLFGGSSTFQLTLFDTGVIVVDIISTTLFFPVVGIGPGNPQAEVNVVDFSVDSPLTAVNGVIAEAYLLGRQVDIFRMAQKFYETHDDRFHFLVMFTNFPFDLGGGFAFELNVSNSVTGIGLQQFDFSDLFGSGGTLQSFLNMNQLDAYPNDLNQPFLGDNSAISIFGQEAGHRWLAFVSANVPGQPLGILLGRQSAHWNFFADSEASVMEGNDWSETSPGIFESVDTVSRFSTLDQYIMGLRAPADVNPFFVIGSPSGSFSAGSGPAVGTMLTGTRIDVTVNNVIAASGARTPAYPFAPTKVRGAIILLTRNGQAPTAGELQKIEDFRVQWEQFYMQATDNRGMFLTGLKPKNSIAPQAWKNYD